MISRQRFKAPSTPVHRLLVISVISLLGFSTQSPADLSPQHRRWLDEVDLIISDEEREAFSGLEKSYQRQAFIEEFWRVRDPLPETRQNELMNRWLRRLEMADELHLPSQGDRLATLMLVGPPREILSGLCPEAMKPIEAWHYEAGSPGDKDFYVIFVTTDQEGKSEPRHWEPEDGLEVLMRGSTHGEGAGDNPKQVLRRRCVNVARMPRILEQAASPASLRDEARRYLTPEKGWTATFLDRTVSSGDAVTQLADALECQFPGRAQSLTVVQCQISLPVDVLKRTSQEASDTLGFTVDGEVVRQGKLTESFRYRFEPARSTVESGQIPVAIQRYLRPGDYEWTVAVKDLVGNRLVHATRSLRVPPADALVEPGTTDTPGAEEDRFAEANAVLEAGDHTVQILPLPEQMLTGRVRVEARVGGTDIARVKFILDGRESMAKTRPPYGIELSLGQAPRLHTLDVIALDAANRELARDSVPINAGPHRFSVRLIEPRSHRGYRRSLRTRAEIHLPPGDRLDRLELYLNESRLATLYQKPFVLPIELSDLERISYVRAVAYLEDGNSTEDIVFINTPSQMDQLTVNMVELYTTVTDHRGSPIDDLGPGDFEVLEEGVPQSIVRFERVQNLSIHAGIVIDASTSMTEELGAAVEAGFRFFDDVLRPRDRAAVIVFNDEPVLRVPFTNNPQFLTTGLDHLRAEGDTALYDTLVYSLYYFAGIRGKRALILLSDGRDSRSTYSQQDVMDFARRSGVTIYSVGMGMSHREIEPRRLLKRLATETGGRAFFVSGASELDSIYASIEEELRSQYLIVYQSSHSKGGDFRRVSIAVQQAGLKVTTIPGYYP